MRRKSTSTQSSQTSNADHASRVRDNKRRHRARHKEYVLDLERRVTEAREQGVQATKEVQLAAQRVARENAKLRDLLRGIGYPDDVVDAWVREDGCGNSRARCAPPFLESTPKKCVQDEESACMSSSGNELDVRKVDVEEAEPPPTRSIKSGDCRAKKSPHPDESLPTKCSESKQCSAKNRRCPEEPSDEQPEEPPPNLSADLAAKPPPCKLVTLLKNNPSADLTQVSLTPPHELDSSSDGVECSSAYSMLMRYATSEQQMDRIAAALEGGCMPSAGGGCKVRKDVVWGVLEEEVK